MSKIAYSLRLSLASVRRLLLNATFVVWESSTSSSSYGTTYQRSQSYSLRQLMGILLT